MDIWVAVLSRVEQLTKVMPNFWRAVHIQFIVFGKGWGSVFSGDPAATLVTCLWVRMVKTACAPYPYAWWRHQMEIFSTLLALCTWPFVWSPVNSPHKGQWRGTLMFSLICAGTYGWINNHEAGDLRRHRGHYYVIKIAVFYVNAYISNPYSPRLISPILSITAGIRRTG